MPMNDWTRVEAGIFHDFHLEWISRIKQVLNARLPPDYYALAERHAPGFGPDVITLQNHEAEEASGTSATATLARPKTRLFQEAVSDFYLRKQNSIAIRHVSGDRVVAMIEIVSPGNKASGHGMRAFVRKIRELMLKKIHFLIVDPFPAAARDPHGLHAAIFEDFEDDPMRLPHDSPLSLIAYECDDPLRIYLEPFAVGDLLADMPVYLYPGRYVEVPLEESYMAAWGAVPRRWRDVIAPATPTEQ